jgi:seryl-tRNA synthetase
MSTKDTLENMARNTWLAGLGSIDSSKDALSKSIDAAQEKSNNLYSELLTKGEEIQSKINDRKDDIQAKGKQLFSITKKVSDEEKIAQLNAAVDQLTSVIVKLVEVRNAEVQVTKSAPKAEVAAKTTPAAKPAETPKATPKAAPKVATATKLAEVATKATKPTETAAKATTKKPRNS